MADESKPTQPQIAIDLDEVTAQGAYCNLVLINHSDSEFVMDFAFLQPAAPRARVRARVVCSPRHAKRLLRALEANVQRFEERFGRIDDGPAIDLSALPRTVS